MARERPRLFASGPSMAGITWWPTRRSRRCCRLAFLALDRTRTADEVGLPETLIAPTRTTSAPEWASPGASTRAAETVLRGGFGLFHPTVAVQGIRDLLATNEFRFTNTTTGGAGTASPAARRHRTSRPSATRDRPQLQSPDIYQYVTLEHELTNYMGLR